MSGITIPPTWDSKQNSADNLRKLVIAQMIGFGSHKGQLTELLESLTTQAVVNGKLVYSPRFELKNKTCDYTSNESMFLKNIVGVDDSGLQDICDASGDADNIWFNWRRRFGFDKVDYDLAISVLGDMMAGVSTIDIESTMVSYWKDKLKLNPDYILPDSTGLLADRVTYDAELTGFHFFATDTNLIYTKLSDAVADWDLGVAPVDEFIPWTYADRVPLDYDVNGNNSFSQDASFDRVSGLAFQLRDDGFNPIIETDITRHQAFTMYGDRPPSIIFRDSGGLDITANYSFEVQRAILSMILISGTSFMSKIGTLTKVSESLDITEGLSYLVVGKQSWNASILTSFVDDVSDLNWYAYTQMVDTDPNIREFPVNQDEFFQDIQGDYKALYGQHLWIFRDTFVTSTNIETLSDGLFMYYNGETYLTVDGFRTCTDKQYGEWIFALARIDPVYDSGGIFGIKGFLGDYLSKILNLVGLVVTAIIDVFTQIILLVFKVTGIYWVLLKVGLSDNNIEAIAEVIAHVILVIVTIGLSEYLELAYATAGVEGATFGATEVVGLTAVAVSEMTFLEVVAQVASLGVSADNNIKLQEAEEEAVRRKLKREEEKELEEEIEEYQNLSTTSSSNLDESALLKELLYNPFARYEVQEQMKYGAFNSFESKDPFGRILN